MEVIFITKRHSDLEGGEDKKMDYTGGGEVVDGDL